MKYRNLGASSLKVSSISIGGWITFGGTIDDGMAHSILDEAVEQGINYIDLADVYARGQAEEVTGRWLKDKKRADYVLSSKCFWPMSDNANDKGLSRKHVIESCEAALKRLDTDYLDILYCHREDPETPLEETARAMDDLVHQGKILYWGTSVWSAGALDAAHELADRRNIYAPQVEQPQYSLVERSIEADVLPAAKRLGMGVVVWSPMAGGLLTGKYNDGIPAGSRADKTSWMQSHLTEERLGKVREYCQLAKELEMLPGQLALAWCLRREELSCVITGATSIEQVRENVKAADFEIPAEALKRLDQLFPA